MKGKLEKCFQNEKKKDKDKNYKINVRSKGQCLKSPLGNQDLKEETTLAGNKGRNQSYYIYS